MDFTPIAQAVITLLAAVVTAFVVPLIKSKTTAAQQQQINAWVRIAVAAAEQIYNGPGRGPDKINYVCKWLRERGITVDGPQLQAMIEAAVYELNNGFISVGTEIPISEGGNED